MATTTPKFNFSFYRFTVTNRGSRTTEQVRELDQADGMRTLVEDQSELLATVYQRINDWASSKQMAIRVQDPFPSEKYPNKKWIDVRFGGLSL